MSFIVFSTEGRILMSLTEDRWVQIPSKFISILFFSAVHLKGVSVIPDLDKGRTQLWVRCVFIIKRFQTDCSVVGLHDYFIMWSWHIVGSLYLYLSSAVSQQPQNLPLLPSYLILQRALPVYLRDSFSSQYTQIPFHFIHLLHIDGISCKCCPYGNRYAVTTHCSVWFWSQVCSRMNPTK